MALPLVTEANAVDLVVQQYRPARLVFVLGEVVDGVVTDPEDLTGCTAQLLVADKLGPGGTVLLNVAGTIPTPADGTVIVTLTAAQIATLPTTALPTGEKVPTVAAYDLILAESGDSRSFFKGDVKLELGIAAS